MSKRTAIPKEKPKKPLTHYFQFRLDRMKALEGQENRDVLIKEEWANMSQEVKDVEKAKYLKEMDRYKALLGEWSRAHPGEMSKDKDKKRKRQADEDEDEEDEKPKGDRIKGAAKAARGKGKKEEEEEEKPEKGKSKGRKGEKSEVDPKSKKGKK